MLNNPKGQLPLVKKPLFYVMLHTFVSWHTRIQNSGVTHCGRKNDSILPKQFHGFWAF